MTAPVDESQVPKPTPGTADLTEGVYVGYRGYTSFAYCNLKATVNGGRDVTATFTVTNTGKVVGAQVPQVYVGTLPTNVVDTPNRQLGGWDKIVLQPGQSMQVSVTVNQQSMSYWDSYANKWIMPSGNLQVLAGAR